MASGGSFVVAAPGDIAVNMDLISLHVPKCAGSSLRDALVCAYGQDRVFFDNADRLLDPMSPINIDRDAFLHKFASDRDSLLNGKCVVHGHFWMRKYHRLNALRVTILRHPVDRLISHYLFWNHLPPHGHTLHDQFLAEKPSLTDFARMSCFRHFYSQVLFLDVDMSKFNLIGSIERMPETIARLENLTGRKLRLQKSNENRCDHCRQEREKISETPGVLAALRDLLADDIAFYERHARPR